MNCKKCGRELILQKSTKKEYLCPIHGEENR